MKIAFAAFVSDIGEKNDISLIFCDRPQSTKYEMLLTV